MAICSVLLRLPASRGETLSLVAGQVLILVKVEHLAAWVEGLVLLLFLLLMNGIAIYLRNKFEKTWSDQPFWHPELTEGSPTVTESTVGSVHHSPV